MAETYKVPYELRNASVQIPRKVDQLVLGADLAEIWTCPSGTNFAILSANQPFWVKADYEALASTGVGTAFTNQPANDGVEIVSSDNGDTTQNITIIGTTQGTDTVVVETKTLTGTSQVATTKTDWGFILAVKLSAACAGTVTVREASGNATITTLTAGVLQKGVVTYTQTKDVGGLVTLVASGASTKVVGLKGTDTSGAVQYDAQALTGATKVLSNLAFATVTEIYVGDIENTVSVIATLGLAHVPTIDEANGYGVLYVPSTTQMLVEQGVSYSFVRVSGQATTVTIGRYS